MPKEFAIPPVVFPSGATAPTPGSPSAESYTGNLQHRRLPTVPFQPQQRPASSSIPFMSFDVGSASTGPPEIFPPSSSSLFFPPTYYRNDASSTLFSSPDEPSLLEELEINPSLIWHKTRSLLNPFRVNSSLHEEPDLSGPFLYYMAFAVFQLLAGKVQFGVILGWITISSIILYFVFNCLAGRNGNLDLYRCFSVVGYSLMPIVFFSAVSLFLPPVSRGGSFVRFVAAGLLVAWATRVSSKLLAENAVELLDHRGLIAYPCFLIYCLFSMLVIF